MFTALFGGNFYVPTVHWWKPDKCLFQPSSVPYIAMVYFPFSSEIPFQKLLEQFTWNNFLGVVTVQFDVAGSLYSQFMKTVEFEYRLFVMRFNFGGVTSSERY